MRFDIISLFPDLFNTLKFGIVGRALTKHIIEVHLWNPRDYTHDHYQTVDDKAYGGGPGMVMKFEPLQKAIHAAKQSNFLTTKVIYLSPQGIPLTQTILQSLSSVPRLILVAGRYEGVDERLIQTEIDEEYSIGDYILSGGEIPILVMIDAITRLLPGAIKNPSAIEQDSFTEGLLEYPQYTKPEKIAGLIVPSVLLSGNHKAIARWRLQQALGRTWQRRPDLLNQKKLSSEEQQLLSEFIEQLGEDNA
jgi:tRNA (guanine37-N1)-methyltransferase